VVAAHGTVPKVAAETPTPERTKGGIHYTPLVDIYQTPLEFVVLCDLPGVEAADLELKVENDELIVYGKVPPRQGLVDFWTGEYGVGDFFRSFTIPPEVDVNLITAEFKMGVLTVHLPKNEAVRTKIIPIIGGRNHV
jgi:HSP20 family protein